MFLKVNEFMCGSLNRTGLLCSQCQEGLSLAAMSYRRECVECSNTSKGIVLFIALAFIPTTAFLLVSDDVQHRHILRANECCFSH